MRETLERETKSDGSVESTRDRALARIAVKPPYFGLGAMEQLGPGIVSALVPPSAPEWPEAGPMAGAQVARHLAIVGSCAAALARDDADPHHYLATQAHYARIASSPGSVNGGLLEAVAVASWIDKRNARALIKLMTPDGQGLHLLDVHYSVLAPRTFNRLNPALGEEATAAGPDPEPVVAYVTNGVTIDCGAVPVSLCEGHFPGNPAAPVAILMGRLCNAAGQAMASVLDADVGYRIEEGHVTATRLARAGQHLILDAEYGKPVPAGHVIGGTARADGEVVGEMTVTLAPIAARA